MFEAGWNLGWNPIMMPVGKTQLKRSKGFGKTLPNNDLLAHGWWTIYYMLIYVYWFVLNSDWICFQLDRFWKLQLSAFSIHFYDGQICAERYQTWLSEKRENCKTPCQDHLLSDWHGFFHPTSDQQRRQRLDAIAFLDRRKKYEGNHICGLEEREKKQNGNIFSPKMV